VARDDDDICANKHGGNPNSRAANRRTDKAKGEARVYAHIWSFGLRGITRDRCEIDLNMGRSTVTARVADMKKRGTVIDTDRKEPTRTGCMAALVVATVHLQNADMLRVVTEGIEHRLGNSEEAKPAEVVAKPFESFRG
jgi:hypothetical protein